MLRRLMLALGVLVSLSAVAAAQTADEIVAKTIAAQGLEKLKPVQALRMTGTMTVEVPGQDAITAPVVIEVKRPNKARMTFTMMGMENAQGYDGQAGWTFMPIQQQVAPQPASADELKDLQEQADIDGSLVDYKAKGHTVELVGKEPVQGTDTYKLKLTLKSGDVQYEYVNAQTFMPVKLDTTRVIQGTPVNVETFVSNYKEEGGVLMPHTVEAHVMGVTQRVTIDKVEMNAQIDDARFKMPEVKK
jgi:outer membrane lipoprotein-sorting protein